MNTLTEEEAKTKWCPHVRWVADPLGRFAFNNRIHDRENFIELGKDDANCKCMGTACMAWRWEGELKTVDIGGGMKEERRVYERGFCGLAGKP